MAWYIADGVLQNTNIKEYPKNAASIRSWSFGGWDRVEVPRGIKEIGEDAFRGYRYLKRIKLPDTLKCIGDGAFADSGLIEIEIPRSVTHIGERIFSGCRSLRKITIAPEHPTFMIRNKLLMTRDGEVILTHPAVVSIEIPPEANRIGKQAFGACERLEQVSISPSVTRIGESAFEKCGSLRKIDIPEGVTTIGARAFFECQSLKEIRIPDGVTEIGAQAFSGCQSLEEIHIPDSVTEIGAQAFFGCKSLKTVCMGEGVMQIGEGAFDGCEKLAQIRIPEGVTEIAKNIFNNCSELESVEMGNSVTSIGEGAFGGCNELENIRIPQTVTDIGSYAFWYCIRLRSMELSAGAVNVAPNAFYRCDRLRSIAINGQTLSKLDESFQNKLKEIRCVAEVHKVPAALRSVVYQSFARQEEEYAEELWAEHIEGIRKNSSRLAQAAFDEPMLLRLMYREKLISARSMNRYVEEALVREDVELTALTLDYKAQVTSRKKRNADDDLELDSLWD